MVIVGKARLIPFRFHVFVLVEIALKSERVYGIDMVLYESMLCFGLPKVVQVCCIRL